MKYVSYLYFSPLLSFHSDLDNYSDISSSRLSISSRTSVTEKVQNAGKATMKKFNSMRKALSLDRLDKAGRNDEPDGGYKVCEQMTGSNSCFWVGVNLKCLEIPEKNKGPHLYRTWCEPVGHLEH